jgi:uncharacterized protein YkwD
MIGLPFIFSFIFILANNQIQREARISELILIGINTEREKKKIDRLSYSSIIDSVSNIHCSEMAKYKFFYHVHPKDKSIATMQDRFRKFKYRYSTCGENIAKQEYSNQESSDEEVANIFLKQWVNSPPHYRNILNQEFKETAIVVYSSRNRKGDVSYYAVQNFATKQ